MFAELLAHPGVIERVDLRSRVGIMAFHGGSLEMGTDEIAVAAAGVAGASLYTVIQPPGFRWHIPSRLIDPADSPKLAAFLDHVDVAIAVHGFGRAGLFTSVLLGGSNRVLAAHVGGALTEALGPHGYEIRTDEDSIPVELRGRHPDNPVNRPRHGGVQMELPPRVRGLGPFWSDHDPTARTPHTAALIDGLATAAATWT